MNSTLPFTAAQIATLVGGEVMGDETMPITGFAAVTHARAGDLTFAEKEPYLRSAEESAASVVLVPAGLTSTKKVLIRVANARVAMARLLPHFFPAEEFAPGIHPSASIAVTAEIDPTAHVGPHCAIGEGVRIGARSVLLGGNHLGRGTTLGDDVCLYPNVTLYSRTVVGHRVIIHAGTSIGADGFGYVFDEGRHRKVVQAGNVVIGDDVEIGANVTIDRGTLGSTMIGAGTKIDNLVHVAHNVIIDRHCLVMGQAGFAGSTHLGDYSVVASQSGIADHLKLGRQTTVGAKSGVMRDIPDGGTVLGIPAAPAKDTKRQWVAVQQLPGLMRRLRDLEKQVKDLKAQRVAD